MLICVSVLICLQMPRFFPQPKDIQFPVIEEERNQGIVTFEKLESENFDSRRLMMILLTV